MPLMGALLASVFFGVASVLQHASAARVPAGKAVDPRLLVRLGRQGPYLAGLALDALAFALSAWALRSLPLFIVQAVLASCLVVTAVVAAVTSREALTWAERRAIGGVVLGLVLLAVAASPEPASPSRHPAITLLLCGLPALLIAAAFLDRRPSASWSGVAFGLLSGLAFGGFGIAARVLGAHQGSAVIADPLVWAMIAYIAVGLLLYGTALQRGKVTSVTAAYVLTETLVPAVVGVGFLGDGARPGLAAVALGGFLLSTCSVLSLIWRPAHRGGGTEPRRVSPDPVSPAV